MEIKISDIDNIRIDSYLIDIIDESRSKIQKLINSSNILVNDNKVKSSYILKQGDVIKINKEFNEEINILPEDIKLDIIYEDDDLLVVNKKSGMVVHPSIGNYNHTLVNALMHHCNLSNINGIIRPGIVHRIDAFTSGLLLVAKNDKAHISLAKQLKDKTTKRKYIALVHGIIKEDTATIDAPIGRDSKNRKKMAVTSVNSKNAVTNIKVLERYKNATLIECMLETGRTHQIRVHLNYIGHPIVNDLVYGIKKVDNKDFGQMLHAYMIGFIHPTTNKYLEFSVDTPKEFYEILDKYKTNS